LLLRRRVLLLRVGRRLLRGDVLALDAGVREEQAGRLVEVEPVDGERGGVELGPEDGDGAGGGAGLGPGREDVAEARRREPGRRAPPRPRSRGGPGGRPPRSAAPNADGTHARPVPPRQGPPPMMTRREALALPLLSLATGGLHPRLAFAAEDDPTKVFTGGK